MLSVREQIINALSISMIKALSGGRVLRALSFKTFSPVDGKYRVTQKIAPKLCAFFFFNIYPKYS